MYLRRVQGIEEAKLREPLPRLGPAGASTAVTHLLSSSMISRVNSSAYVDVGASFSGAAVACVRTAYSGRRRRRTQQRRRPAGWPRQAAGMLGDGLKVLHASPRPPARLSAAAGLGQGLLAGPHPRLAA